MFVTIRAKLIGFSFLSLLCILLVGGAGYYGGHELSNVLADTRGNSEAMDSHMQTESAHGMVRADVLQVLLAAKSGDAAAFEGAKKSLNEHAKILTSNTSKSAAFVTLSETTRKAITAVHTDSEGLVKLAKEIAVLAMTDSGAAEAQFNLFNKTSKALEANQSAVNNLLSSEIGGLRSSSEDVLKQTLLTATTILVTALIILSLFLLYIYRGIINPLNQLRRAIRKVEGGIYDVRVNLQSKDELGAVGRAFDKMLDERIASLSAAASENEKLNNSVIGLFAAMGALAEKDLTVRAPVTEDIIGTLGDAINQLTDVTSTVLHDVTNIASVVEHASERMKQQSDVVNMMAKEEDVIVARLVSNLETAMASIGEVAIFARDSNRAAGEATKSTESAMQTVQATISGMNTIRETISEMEKRIKRLGERSQEISQIVNLINTISERTHVLSLNAAMQAAMAGDAGRGFAVVAEEVQRLAENSRQATGQIANLVQNIQVETNDTIATVNKTIDQVVKESELAHNAGERMRETHEATARLVRLVATIATSSAEQTKIGLTLRAAADEITQFTAKTAEQLAAQNQGAASLVTASKKLMESVSVFKLPPVAT